MSSAISKYLLWFCFLAACMLRLYKRQILQMFCVVELVRRCWTKWIRLRRHMKLMEVFQ